MRYNYSVLLFIRMRRTKSQPTMLTALLGNRLMPAPKSWFDQAPFGHQTPKLRCSFLPLTLVEEAPVLSLSPVVAFVQPEKHPIYTGRHMVDLFLIILKTFLYYFPPTGLEIFQIFSNCNFIRSEKSLL
jgi:hypothetical protein